MLYMDMQMDFTPIYSILAVSILFITAEDTYGEYIFFYEIMQTIYKEDFVRISKKQRKRNKAEEKKTGTKSGTERFRENIRNIRRMP